MNDCACATLPFVGEYAGKKSGCINRVSWLKNLNAPMKEVV